MSTIKVNKIENTSTADGGVAIDVDGHVTIDGQQLPTAGPLSNRNKIINGDMRIDQRNAGASINNGTGSTDGFVVDRWNLYGSQGSKLTGQQNAGSVTPPAGFNNYAGITSFSAYSVLVGDYFRFSQRIEGFDTANLGWGTANASDVTLSFWVRSSLTGTFGGALTNGAFDRSYPFTYSINSADTWEFITIPISGDTTGTWATDNSIGIAVYFGLGVGATYSGTAGAWTGSGNFSATGAISVVGTSGATFYLTGVQLEVGSKATPFEHRSYGDELQRCQRYYTKFTATAAGERIGVGYVDSATNGACLLHFPVEMRTNPTSMDQSGTASDYSVASTSVATCTAVPTFSIATKNSANVIMTASMPGAVRTCIMARYNSTNAFFGFPAEL